MGKPENLKCPKCGANEVKDLRWSRNICMGIFFTNALFCLCLGLTLRTFYSWSYLVMAGLAVFGGVIYLVAGARWKCAACEFVWH